MSGGKKEAAVEIEYSKFIHIEMDLCPGESVDRMFNVFSENVHDFCRRSSIGGLRA